MIENPEKSLIWRYSPLKDCMCSFGPDLYVGVCHSQELLARHRARSVTISLGNFGGMTKKDVVLYGTHPMLPELAAMNQQRNTALRRPRAELIYNSLSFFLSPRHATPRHATPAR